MSTVRSFFACLMTALATSTPAHAGPQSATRSSGPEFFLHSLRHTAGTQACSEDYGKLDGCYNTLNPPLPSIMRSVESASNSLNSSLATHSASDQQTIAFPMGQQSPGKTQILPFDRGSNDGRLLFLSDEMGISLAVFRPEVLQHELKRKNVSAISGRSELHPLMFYNPWETRFPYANQSTLPSLKIPNAYHNNICDDSGSANSPQGQLSLHRNPVSCLARYLPTDPLIPGDCYDITFQANMDDGNLANGTHPPSPPRWEIRTVALTVFVSHPKSAAAGTMIFSYPRQPLSAGPNRILPPFRDYDLHAAHVPHLNFNGSHSLVWPQILTGFTHPDGKISNARTLCYKTEQDSFDFQANASLKDGAAGKSRRTTKNIRMNRKLASIRELLTSETSGWVRDLAGPKWCEYFDHQSYSKNGFIMHDRLGPNPSSNPALTTGIPYSGQACGNMPTPGCDNQYALFEPSTTADGRVLFINSMKGLLYSVNQEGACKAAGWKIFKPISMMPVDPQMYQLYDIAKAQRDAQGNVRKYRDSLGQEIDFGAPINGAYGWIDREAKNFFFAHGNTRRDHYRAMNMSPIGTDDNPDQAAGRGHAVLGAWTQGKIVVMDNGTNHFESMTGDKKANQTRAQYDIGLYRGGFSGNQFVNVSSYLRIRPSASSSVFSFENRFNFIDAMMPTLPFDVVWNIQTNNQRNSEIAFDEYMMNSAFVIAHMNSPIDRNNQNILDGFATRNPSNTSGFSFIENPLLQNAATTSEFHSTAGLRVPSHLRLRGGARVEPLGLGGVLGKGVYLDGANDHIEMRYPRQKRHREWYLGIWLDRREDDLKAIRTIYYFPDHSWIGLHQNKLVSFNPYASASRRIMETPIEGLIANERYFHLGIRILSKGSQRTLEYLINGTAVQLPGPSGIHASASALRTAPHESLTVETEGGFDLLPAKSPAFPHSQLRFVVGEPGLGAHPLDTLSSKSPRKTFKGWVDELRIHSLTALEKNNPWFQEFACNLALGTMVDVSRKPGETHQAKLNELRAIADHHGILWNSTSEKKSVCEQMALGNYLTPTDLPPQRARGHLCIDKVHKNGADPRCIRKELLDPVTRVRVVAGAPRENFAGTAFCLSCHSDQAKIKGLSVEALRRDPHLNRELDPRRQPMDHPAIISGELPLGVTATSSNPVFNCSYAAGSIADCRLSDWLFDFSGKLNPAP